MSSAWPRPGCTTSASTGSRRDREAIPARRGAGTDPASRIRQLFHANRPAPAQMIFFKAQRMQQLAQQLLALQRRLEAGSGDTTHIREGLEEVARRVGVDLEIVRLAHPDTVLDVLAPEGGGDPGKVWAVAEVLFLDGIRARAEGEPGEGLDALRKARYLYRTLGEGLVLPDEATPPDQRLDTLGAILSDPA